MPLFSLFITLPLHYSLLRLHYAIIFRAAAIISLLPLLRLPLFYAFHWPLLLSLAIITGHHHWSMGLFIDYHYINISHWCHIGFTPLILLAFFTPSYFNIFWLLLRRHYTLIFFPILLRCLPLHLPPLFIFAAITPPLYCCRRRHFMVFLVNSLPFISLSILLSLLITYVISICYFSFIWCHYAAIDAISFFIRHYLPLSASESLRYHCHYLTFSLLFHC